MDVSLKQREIALLGKQNLVLTRQRKHIVVTAKVIKCISEVDRSIPVLRQPGEHLISELSRFEIFAGQEEVSLGLAHHSRIIFERSGRAIDPGLRQRELVIFKRGVSPV